MKIGIIGCGGVASAHIRALQCIDAVSGIYGYDMDASRPEALEKLFPRFQAMESFSDMITSVDGVIISTPNNTHLKVLKDIISIKNIPVLSEKPLASSVEDANEFMKLAHSDSAINFNYRFNPVISLILKIKKDYELGELVFVDVAFNKNSALSKKTLSWRDQENQNNSSGAFGDLGSHLFDLIHYLAGSTINKNSLKISIGKRVKTRAGVDLTVDDNCIVTGMTVGETLFKMQASKSSPEEELGFHVYLICQHGEIKYSSSNSGKIKVTYINQVRHDFVEVDLRKLIDDPSGEIPYWSDSFYFQNLAWTNTLRGRRSLEVATIQDGCYIQELLSVI
ncbi:MAG: Gfo/Idh/MocA family oxidoreductase [Pseudomonadota bacterium]